MTRIVDFSDTFTAATEPSIEGVDQEDYGIQNNATNVVLFSLDSTVYKSAFLDFEISRNDSVDSYQEIGKIQLIYHEETWKIAKGVSIGHEIITESLDNPFNVVLSMTTTLGVGSLKYSSGNMGILYSGSFKISITRIVA